MKLKIKDTKLLFKSSSLNGRAIGGGGEKGRAIKEKRTFFSNNPEF